MSTFPSDNGIQVPISFIVVPVVFVVIVASCIVLSCIRVKRNKERMNQLAAPQAQGPITSMNPYAAYEPQQLQPQQTTAIAMQPDSNIYQLPRAPSPAHSHSDSASLIQEQELEPSYPPPKYQA